MKKILFAFFALAGISAGAQTVKTFAGTPGVDGFNVISDTITNAKFTNPIGILIDPSDRIYISEEGSHRIRLFVPAEGRIYTRSGSIGNPTSGNTQGYLNQTGTNARYNSPAGMAFDAAGNLYIADQLNHCIRKLTKYISSGSGQIASTFAGEDIGPGAGTGSYANGQGTAARFNNPTDVAIDPSGNLYVADAFNDCIRKIDPSGNVTLLAGTPTANPTYGFQDGAATSAKFDFPFAVEMESATSLLVADIGNRRIRRINLSTLQVSTVAGAGTNGGTDGAALSAEFSAPDGLALDAFGNIFVADGKNGQANTIRKISGGQVSTIAGTFNQVGTTDGQETAARFDHPAMMDFNSTKDLLYVADWANHTVRSINLKPISNFVGNTQNISVNSEVNFTSTSLGHPTTYLWEVTPNTGVTFTQSTTSASANPSMKFSQTGTYTIKLTVTNAYGTNAYSRDNYINVSNTGGTKTPVADFKANRVTLVKTDTVKFTDLSTNTPTTWEWSFAPSNVTYVAGTTTNSQNPQVLFTQNGAYSVSLKASNSVGNNTKTKTNYIIIVNTSVKEVSLDDMVNVYPNPSNGKMTIDLGSLPIANTLHVGVFDITGKAVYENILMQNPGKIDLDLSNQVKGIYFVTLFDGVNRADKKIVVE